MLRNLNYNFDITAFSELWVPSQDLFKKKYPTIQGYHDLNCTKGYSCKSGYGLFVKEGLSFIHRPELNVAVNDNENAFQSTSVEILTRTQLIFSLAYITDILENLTIIYFNEKLKETLKIVNKKQNCLCREFSYDSDYDLLKTEYNDYVREFVDIMYCNYFQHCILEPTSILKT